MLRSDRFPESKDSTIKLPEDDVSSFAVFAEYLYTGDECDTGAVLRDIRVKDMPDNDKKEPSTPGAKEDSDDAWEDEEMQDEKAQDEEAQDEEAQDEGAQDEEMQDEENAAHDDYDFMLQFSCYVLADKLQAPKFKRLIMNEIRNHGEFCDPTNLKMEHVRYVYNNTIRRNDPLRRFCVMVKCKQMPVEDTLADAEFINFMEEGGPLVKDIMQACRKQTLKQKEMIEEHERQIQTAKKELKQVSARKQSNPAKWALEHYRHLNVFATDSTTDEPRSLV